MVGKVLIAGGSGVVGGAAISAFSDAGWQVVSLSRRTPELRQSGSVVHHAVDLANKTATSKRLEALHDVSHVVFAAVAEAPSLISGWFDGQQM